MALPARRAGTAASSESTETIARLLGGFSLEATFPSAAEIEALKKSAPAGTRIYLSCPPNHSAEKLVEYAVNVRNAGFEPVPHLTARAYPDRATLDNVLSQLTREAAVRSVLAIAGDRDDVAGPFEGALALIESGALEAHGVTDVDISGYPDGHPKIDNKVLEDAMEEKLPALVRRKLAVNITTQFCFEPDLILAWIRRIRASGIDVPLRVGVAGPTSLRALMRLALRCGVRASVRGAMNPKTMQLFGDATPDEIIRALAEAEDRAQLGNITVHFFSFGGLVATSDWAVAVAEERITPTANGFRVIK